MGVISIKMMVDRRRVQADVWLMSELSGVVYMVKRMGPEQSPGEHHKKEVVKKRGCLDMRQKKTCRIDMTGTK